MSLEIPKNTPKEHLKQRIEELEVAKELFPEDKANICLALAHAAHELMVRENGY